MSGDEADHDADEVLRQQYAKPSYRADTLAPTESAAEYAGQGYVSIAVVIVRDPDAANVIDIFGAASPVVVDLDLGRSDLTDPDECLEWAAAHYADMRALADLGHFDAADHVRGVIGDQLMRAGVPWAAMTDYWKAEQ